MATHDDTPQGGTALIVVPGVGDDAPGDTVGAMSRALLSALGPGAHSTPLTRTIVVPGLPGSRDAPRAHEVRGARVHVPTRPDPLVVYEMHWADLSRFPGTLRRFVLTLYGLLFQVSTIGIEAFRAIPAPRWPQQAIRLFSYLMAVLMLGLTAGAAILGVEFAALVRLDERWQQVLVLGLTLAGVGALAWLGDRFLRGNGWRFEGVWWGLGRPGVAFGAIALGVGVVPLLIRAEQGTSPALAVHDVLWFSVRWVLPVAWASVGVVVVAIALTMLAVIPADSADRASGARYRGTRTAVLSVVVGGLGIALLGALLVSAGLTATANLTGAGTPVPAGAALDVGAPSGEFGDYASRVFDETLRPLGAALLCALALVVVVAVAGFRFVSALVQASWRRAAPPVGGFALAVAAVLGGVIVAALLRASSPVGDAVAVAVALGVVAPVLVHWAIRFRPDSGRAPIRRGFDRLLAYLGSPLHVLLLSGALLMAGAALALATPWTPAAAATLADLSDALLAPLTAPPRGSSLGDGLRVSALVGLLLTILLAMRGRLASMATSLDVAYDVATYMRVPHGSPGADEPPVEPPRRRVLRRYATLLDHIETVQKPERIVIAAHSQGSVYSLALLFGDVFRDRGDAEAGPRWPIAPRLLPPRENPGTAPVLREDAPVLNARLSLLTAGCPIRQTYAPNFPGQYDWLSDTAAVTSMLEAIAPGTTWSNAYRSGDYLGRALWGDRVCDPLPPPAPLREICLGPGQHAGYWGDRRFARAVLDLL